MIPTPDRRAPRRAAGLHEPRSAVVQLLNGLASASSLFLVAVGLSLIFGVSRIVNFAHGSFYMVGVYVAYSLVAWVRRHAAGLLGRDAVRGAGGRRARRVVEIVLCGASTARRSSSSCSAPSRWCW